MKKVIIKGKHNNDMLNKTEKKALRQNIKYDEPSYEEQVKLINKYFLEQDDIMKQFITKELDSKINGYKAQDRKKQLDCVLINREEIVEKLLVSRLLCNYCRGKVKILFEEVRDNSQWTLDRIDNNIGHSKENTVICCLKCNLERRRLDAEKFRFTKQLKIKKTD